MRTPPVIASLQDKVKTLTASMITHDIGSIIVMNNSIPVGIITEKDVLEVVNKGKDPNKTEAKDIMSIPLVTINYDNSVGEALNLMSEKHVRRLAVIRYGKLVGIVTERRLLLWSTLK